MLIDVIEVGEILYVILWLVVRFPDVKLDCTPFNGHLE